jgi:hypothetical protein
MISQNAAGLHNLLLLTVHLAKKRYVNRPASATALRLQIGVFFTPAGPYHKILDYARYTIDTKIV